MPYESSSLKVLGTLNLRVQVHLVLIRFFFNLVIFLGLNFVIRILHVVTSYLSKISTYLLLFV